MGDCTVPRQCVVVTGFGPFNEHTVNASWQAVQELKKLDPGSQVELVIEELPVVYKTVSQRVPELWQQHKPQLMVHVGVSSRATKVTLEQRSFNGTYTKPDVDGYFAKDGVCVAGGAECIKSTIDMSCVCDAINEDPCVANAEVSWDTGRFLCDFTYYISLNIDKNRTAFIHVPCLGKPFTAKELAEGIRVAINNMMQQLPKEAH